MIKNPQKISELLKSFCSTHVENLEHQQPDESDRLYLNMSVDSPTSSN